MSATPSENPANLTELTLSGQVEKVIFQNEGSGFQVISVRDPQGKIHCACGNLSGVCAGQGVELKGHWEFHPDHGRRFRAESCLFSLPATLDGIEKYLASGAIKGIGEKYAKAIVDTFGTQTLQVLDNATSRLKEVPGLGKKRIEAIKKAWKESAGKRSLQMYMQSLGITPAYFNRIYSLYADRSAEILRTDPYQLASEVDGIGFLTADRIAAQSGIGKDAPQRLISGVTYALGQIRTAGHVCMPEPEFRQKLAELLEVDEARASEAVKLAIQAKKAVIVPAQDGTPMIYEPGLLRCEQELPLLVSNLIFSPRHYGEWLLKYRPLPGSKFSDEQLAAVERAGKCAVSIITGGPGVGKTTVVGEIVRRARAAKLDLVLAAPTGRAAKRMSETTGVAAATLHRLLKWDPVKRQFIHNRAKPLPNQLFVLDEVSMLDLPLSVAFFRAIRPGSAVVLVGDADQLPSVGPGTVLNDLISCGEIPVSRLTRIFRQGSGSGIIRAAHEVNQGTVPAVPPADPAHPGDFYWIEKDDPEEAAQLIERLVTERIPRRFGLDPKNDIQVLSPMNRGVCGTVQLNERLQNLLNPEKAGFRSGERVFHAGDKVMQITNNYDKGVFNGDMGTILSIRHSDSTFKVRYDLGDVEYNFTEGVQLAPAYAVTVHKSQGSEFPAVVMPVLTQHFMMLQRNLLYTGMTRAKKLMILIGSRKAVSMAVRNFVREPRHTLLPERLKDAFRVRTQRGM
ncbi:MAG: ATP-dependent RecD-like DNA helicase [Lentisphaeria bacterium]|nr:ATP-dependent RecD-like DNA helicase [Lentisphaeria bacterium]